ncbi:MAG: 23S rRNA (guanosine(2251)-2'-O)-methyltransferase RlmB [Oscillospiraceae bacterium]|nr:23S rRNA (guanosine(2251)-2'-O)-methyltransferase RlmB [Oscillospiraceae bacterium]
MDREYKNDVIAGKNPVLEALKAQRPINKIFIQRGERERGREQEGGRDQERVRGLEQERGHLQEGGRERGRERERDGVAKLIEALARERGIPVQFADKAKLDGFTGGGAHQGVLAIASLRQYSSVEDILKLAIEKNESELIIVLDGIEDPHNLGAIIRTAEAVGAHGVIIPKRRAAGLTQIVGKTSSGAVEFVNIARVPNIVEVLKNLKRLGVWVIGTDMDPNGTEYLNCDMRDRIALVFGGEGKGLGRLVRETCDFVVNIPMKGRVASLNASVAAGVIMYEALRQRRQC